MNLLEIIIIIVCIIVFVFLAVWIFTMDGNAPLMLAEFAKVILKGDKL